MRFIKDLIAWKQQPRDADEDEFDPSSIGPGPLVPPRARSAAAEAEAEAEDDEEWDDEDDDQEYEDEAYDEAEMSDDDQDIEYEDEDDFDDEEYEDEEFEEIEAELEAEGLPPEPAPAVSEVDQSATYDLLSRVVRNSSPPSTAPEKSEPAPAPATPPAPLAAAAPAPEPAIAAPRPVEPRPVEARAIEPAEPPAPVEQAAPKPAKIWNITPGESPARRPEVSLPAEPVTPRIAEPAAPVAAAAPAGGRAKTRLLGFHHPSVDAADPFDAPAAAAQDNTARFPTGWLVVVEGPGRGTSITLGEGVSQIGRGEDQAIRLDFGDTAISRQNHAAVAFDPETRKFFLGHGGKSNIVRLNGRPVLSTEEMASYDLIKIGETVLRFVAFCDEEFTWSEERDGAADAAAAG